MIKQAPYNENMPTYFDVDYTLVKFNSNNDLVVHQGHVDALKRHYLRGHKIVVWSKGGKAWAEHVVKLLNLTEYVHQIEAKPMWIYDDRELSELGERIYCYNKEFNNGTTVGTYPDDNRPAENSSSVHTTTSSFRNILSPVSKEQSNKLENAGEPNKNRSGAV